MEVSRTSGHVDDAVPRQIQDPKGLQIAIVGAGIGGLTAALGLRQNGHQVHVYEQSGPSSQAGAAVHLAPNANGVLRRWGIFAEHIGANPMNHLVEYLQDGRLRKNVDLRVPNRRWQHPWHLVYRVSLHDKLRSLAVGDGGVGVPVTLHTSSRVVGVDPGRGTLTLEDGTVVAADLIVGADGIYSITRRYIKDAKLFSSGKAAFRFLIARDVAEADPVTAPLIQQKDTLFLWYSEDRRIVVYPCNDNQLLNFVCIHPDDESHATRSDEWDKQGSVEQLLHVYHDFDPAVRTLMSKVDPATLKVWQLLDMETLPTWTAGRMVLLGDAAHPFTPHQGQGAGQAIEDAAALSAVLPGGITIADIPERLELYEEIRRERAHVIQEYSRLAGMDWVGGQPRVDMMAYTNYNFGHDVVDHANDMLRRRHWARDSTARDRFRGLPTPFGPFWGPLSRADGISCVDQTADARAVPGTDVPDTTRVPNTATPPRTTAGGMQVSLTFRTSRTLLETLFPTRSLRFGAPDTVVTASFRATTRQCNGHDDDAQLGFYIHGVQHVRKDGTVVDGVYRPVLFSDSSSFCSCLRQTGGGAEDSKGDGRGQPVQSGESAQSGSVDGVGGGVLSETMAEAQIRQTTTEPGTLVSCDIAVDQSTSGCHVTVSSYGVTFLDLVLSDLDTPNTLNHSQNPPRNPETILVYHPSQGGGDYLPIPTSHPVGNRLVAADGKGVHVKTHARDWDQLPTLHHVAAVLAEIPVYEVVGGEIVY